MTIYTSDSSNGLYLQSVTEQRHQGGLFSVSAEFLRLSGTSVLPDSIPSSEGDIDVYPNPTVTIGTDGFERVNATGYDIWSTNTARQISLEVGTLALEILGWIFVPGQNGAAGNWELLRTKTEIRGYLFEIEHVSRMRLEGDSIIPATSILRVLNFSGAEVTQYTHPGTTKTAPIIVTQSITNIKVNNFGGVEQVEVVKSILRADVTIIYDNPLTP